jgi:hypothetical protein
MRDEGHEGSIEYSKRVDEVFLELQPNNPPHKFLVHCYDKRGNSITEILCRNLHPEDAYNKVKLENPEFYIFNGHVPELSKLSHGKTL